MIWDLCVQIKPKASFMSLQTPNIHRMLFTNTTYRDKLSSMRSTCKFRYRKKNEWNIFFKNKKNFQSYQKNVIIKSQRQKSKRENLENIKATWRNAFFSSFLSFLLILLFFFFHFYVLFLCFVAFAVHKKNSYKLIKNIRTSYKIFSFSFLFSFSLANLFLFISFSTSNGIQVETYDLLKSRHTFSHQNVLYLARNHISFSFAVHSFLMKNNIFVLSIQSTMMTTTNV